MLEDGRPQHGSYTVCAPVMLPTGWQSTFEHLQKEPELLGAGQCGTVKGQLLEGLGRLEHRKQERSVQRFPGESDLQHLQAAF